MLEKWLTEIVADLELGMLAPQDDQKRFSLSLNPQMTVLFKELDPGVLLEAKIAPCPKERREELFIYLMKANFLGQGTGGAVIGLDKDEKFLTLSLALPYDMNYKAFKEALEDFANYVDYWREELVRHQTTAQNVYR